MVKELFKYYANSKGSGEPAQPHSLATTYVVQ